MNDGEVTFGFIGFGEVAASFSEAMLRRGATVWAFDHKLHDKGGLKTLKARSRAPGVSFADMPEIANNSTVLLSTVTPGSALEVALSCVKFLDRRHTYIDLNSIDPNRKRLIARIVSDAGASFLEGAILKSVRTFGPKARVLLCGQRSITMTEVFNRYGIDAEALGKDIGRASTFK